MYCSYSLTDFAAEYKKLWANEKSIYVQYFLIDDKQKIFKYGILKEFDDPVGVFILVETNFNCPER